MGQACSSQVCVASEAPKHVDESCKTPRDLKEKPLQDVAHVYVQATATAAAPQAVPPSTHEVSPAAVPIAAASAPSAEGNSNQVDTHADPTAQHVDTTHPAAETKPYVDAASLLKPVQEVSLAPPGAAEQTADPEDQKNSHCLAEPEPSQHAPEQGQHSLQDSHTPSTEEVQHAAHADLQDSTHQEEQPQHKTDDAADNSEHQPTPAGQELEGHQGQDEEAGDGGHRSRKTTADAVATQHSIRSNSSVSQELSGLTVAASPDALVDEVSQSVLKAPTAAPSNFTSRAGSGSLHAEHSKASDDAKDHEEHANTDNHHSSELAQEHSSTKEHHEHTNVPNEHSSELAQEHSSTKEHHEHASIPNEHSSELHKEHSSTKEHSEHASIPNEHSSELHKEHSSTKEHTDHASIPNEHSSAKELDEHASMQKQHSAELPKEHSAEAQHDHPGGHEHGEPSAE